MATQQIEVLRLSNDVDGVIELLRLEQLHAARLQSSNALLSRKVAAYDDGLGRVGKTIQDAVDAYVCEHTTDVDGDGISLMNVLTPKSSESIYYGREECRLLAEHLTQAVVATIAQRALEAVRDEKGEVK